MEIRVVKAIYLNVNRRQKRLVCGPVVLRTWSCSETILVCLDIRDLLGFVLLGMVFGWACHARLKVAFYIAK